MRSSASENSKEPFEYQDPQNKQDRALAEMLKFCNLRKDDLEDSNHLITSLDKILTWAENREGL